MFKAIFFDLDETLIAVMNEHKEANRKVFASYGIDFSIVEAQTKGHDFLGKRVKEVLETMRNTIGETESSLPLNLLVEKRQDFFLELVQLNGTPLPGAKQAIKKAKAHGMIVAIV